MSEMTAVKTSELEGAALDWAVGKALGGDVGAYQFASSKDAPMHDAWTFPNGSAHTDWHPSTDWSQGGMLVDQYLVEFRTQAKGCQVLAWAAHEPKPSYGPTHLVAACRAVASIELGDEVGVPSELLRGEP